MDVQGNLRRRFALTAGIGCAVLTLLLVVAIPAAFMIRGEGSSTSKPFWLTNRSSPSPPTMDQAVDGSSSGLPDTGQVYDSTPPFVNSPHQFIEIFKQVESGVVQITILTGVEVPPKTHIGSGFVIQGGYILTTDEMVQTDGKVVVTFFDGRQVEASRVGMDPVSHLGILKVEKISEEVRPLTLGDSENVEVGAWVLALSHPDETGGKMNTGIISASGLPAEGENPLLGPSELFQLDRAIRKASLGGPVLNLAGEVIGITTFLPGDISRDASGEISQDYVLPSKVIQQVLPTLIQEKAYQWSWLGLEGKNVDLFLEQANELEAQSGVYVTQVDPDGPAARAGIQGTQGFLRIDAVQVPVGGDIIVAAEGKPIANLADLLNITSFHQPGETVELTILRGGMQHRVTITLATRPE